MHNCMRAALALEFEVPATKPNLDLRSSYQSDFFIFNRSTPKGCLNMSSDEKSTTPPSSPFSPLSSPAKKMRYGRTHYKDTTVVSSDEGMSDSNGGNGDDHQIGGTDEQDSDDVLVEDKSEGGQVYTTGGSFLHNKADSSSSDELSSDDDTSSEESSDEAESDSSPDDNSDVSSDSGDSSNDSDESYDGENNEDKQMLYDGSQKTTDEAVLKLMTLYIKRMWRKSTLQEVLSYNAEFFPSNLPKTAYKLFKYVEDLTPDSYKEIKHYYCSDCLCPKLLDSRALCEKCQSDKTSVFFELPVAVQIQHMFEFRNLASLVDSYGATANSNSSAISDICSGSGYKSVKHDLKGKYDLTLLFNTDGVSPVRSSGAHLYPILATICEIHPSLRSGFMIVCGVWYDLKSAPIMNDFFCPFTNELQRLHEEGVTWTDPRNKKETVTTKVAAPVMSADALARADALLIQHHNGRHGCGTCEQKSVRIAPTEEEKQKSTKKLKKVRRYVFREKPARRRGKLRMDRQGRKAERLKKPVKGVVGLATVSKIPHFDRSKSAPPEYMHLICLGVVRLLLTLWLEIPGAWNIKDKVKRIDKFILGDIKVTDQISRIPKRLKELAQWKASELRAWLLFVSLPALQDALPAVYFQHYMLFVSAVFTLLKDNITESDLSRAEIKLRVFVREFSNLYGDRQYVYNVHNLLHLCEYVRMWGPLWAFSAFPFESFNHILSVLAHGTKHKGQEIVNRIKLSHGVEILRSKVGQAAACPSKNCVLGSPVDVDLSDFGVEDVDAYQRARHDGQVFTAKSYDDDKKRANSFVHFKVENATGYGQILYFYRNDNNVYAVVKKFQVEHTKMFSHVQSKSTISHLIPVRSSDATACVLVSSLTKLAKVGQYLCIRPNVVEVNL